MNGDEWPGERGCDMKCTAVNGWMNHTLKVSDSVCRLSSLKFGSGFEESAGEILLIYKVGDELSNSN